MYRYSENRGERKHWEHFRRSVRNFSEIHVGGESETGGSAPLPQRGWTPLERNVGLQCSHCTFVDGRSTLQDDHEDN